MATQNRIVFLDYLRAVACFMVMAVLSAVAAILIRKVTVVGKWIC